MVSDKKIDLFIVFQITSTHAAINNTTNTKYQIPRTMSTYSNLFKIAIPSFGVGSFLVYNSYDHLLLNSIWKAKYHNEPLRQELLLKLANNSIIGKWGRPKLLTFAVKYNEPWILDRIPWGPLYYSDELLRNLLANAHARDNHELVRILKLMIM